MRSKKHAVIVSALVCLIVGVLLASPFRLFAAPEFALQFDGVDDRVTFGAAPQLGASNFTLELWFMRTGTGTVASTGTGGVSAVPLVTKGRGEAEGSNVDMNYFLGIEPTKRVLVADFEDTVGGVNHPVTGKTAICDNIWYHAAATYDGTTWRLYLDGVLDAQLVVGAFTPRADSIQHAAIGTALNSTGAVTSGQTQGFFDGVIDEARVWNYPRTIGQISRGRNFEIANAPGLLGRWSFNAGTGTVLADSTGHGINGTVTGAGFAWVAGVPFPTQGNSAPAAVADAVSTPEDSAAVIAVVSNDTDADGDVLTVTSAGAALHGTTVLGANGSITYTPAANYNGPDSFTYGLSDNQGGVSTGTVTLTVTPVNDAPVAANDAYSAAEDAPLTIPAPGVLGNDSDLDLDPLSAVVVTPPAHGVLTLNADGSFTYTPAANYDGGDSFTYRASDGVAQSGLATVTISVANANDAPVGAPDAYTATEDTTLTVAAPGVLGNDTDGDDDPISVVPLASPAHGSLTLNTDGSLVYTPAPNFNGVDTFTYVVTDGTLESAPVTVTITVGAVNDAPVAAHDSYGTNEDVALTIPAPGVLGNDTDQDGNPLTAVIVSQPANGILVLNADAVSYTHLTLPTILRV